MPFKTILVHLADDPDHMQRLETAIALARRFGAHLTAVYVETPLSMPAAAAGRGASLGFEAAASDAARKHAAKVEQEFRKRAGRSGLQAEWRIGAGEHAVGLVLGASNGGGRHFAADDRGVEVPQIGLELAGQGTGVDLYPGDRPRRCRSRRRGSIQSAQKRHREPNLFSQSRHALRRRATTTATVEAGMATEVALDGAVVPV